MSDDSKLKISKVVSNLMELNSSKYPMKEQMLIKESINLLNEIKSEADKDTQSLTNEGESLEISVMVVDDDLTLQKILKTRLERRGFKVNSFPNPANAIKEVANIKPDIIILDIMMPEMTGFEVIQNIKKQNLSSMPKIIVGSSRQYTKDRLHTLELGADDYLNKPYNIEELCLRIKNLLK